MTTNILDAPIEQSREEPREPSGKSMVCYLLPSLIVNGVLPIVLYNILKSEGVATVPALVVGSIFPIANSVWSWRKTRHPDLIGIITLVLIVLSAAASLISGSVHFTLLKESLLTGLFGLVFLGSLLAPRPLSFFLARQFSTKGDPARMAAWDSNWQYPGFRRVFRVMTVIWGVMYLTDALIRVALVFVLSVSVFLVVSQIVLYGTIALTFYASIAYGRRAWKKVRAQREEHLVVALAAQDPRRSLVPPLFEQSQETPRLHMPAQEQGS